MLDRLTIFLEEQMIVIDLSGAFHLVAQCELAIQDLQRPRAQGNPPVFSSVRGIPVDASHPRLLTLRVPAWVSKSATVSGICSEGRIPVKNLNSS